MKSKLKLTALFLGLALLWVSGAYAQQTPPTPQFAFLGFIQEATLDTNGAVCTPKAQTDAAGAAIDVSRLRGGTMTVNGIKLIVPCNSIIQFPAATFLWADLFDPAVSTAIGSYVGALTAPVPANPVAGSLAPAKTGLALADSPMPFPSFEVSVNGNIVGKNADGTDRYIVGLIVPVAQQGLNSSSGLVSCIDYVNGSFRVGGIASTAVGGACPATGATGTLVQFNDPVTGSPGGGGRWGQTHSIDPRFSGDFANTTIHTSTGFPLCIPRVAPPAADAECPLTNRPQNGDPRFPIDPFLAAGAPLKIFDMPAPAIDANTGLPIPGSVSPDPTKQIPLMVGDQVVYAGTSYLINPSLTRTVTLADGSTATVPDTTAANTYISAHTVEDVLGIFTAPGVPPSYVYIEAFLIGSNGAAVQGILQEASTRLTVVGFTSDPTRLVDIYARDVNPCTGQESLRLLASEDPAVDAIRGRFVHRVLGGLFMPPTRNYTIRSRTQAIDPLTFQRKDFVAANGILTGEFSLPNFEYVFPENHRLGDPFIPNNYQDMPFLAFGSGPANGFGSGTAIVGQLDPWPGSLPAPAAPTCAPGGGAAPIVTIDPTIISVGTRAAVTLRGAVAFDPLDDPLTRTAVWAQVSGTPVVGTPGGTLTAPTYTFQAPNTAGPLVFKLTATDNFGSNFPVPGNTMTVNVLAATDIVQIPAGLAIWTEQKGKRGGFGKLNVTATSSDPTANLTLLEDPNEALIPGAACPFLSPVDGGICDWGTASKTSPGVFDWVENKGAPLPFSLTVISDKGGTATVVCSAPTVKQSKLGALRTVSCP